MTKNGSLFSGIGPSSRTGALGREIDAQFDFESGEGGRTVAERIEQYTPQMPSDYWDTIGDFVRSCVADAQPSSRISAQKSLRPVTALVLWSWQLGYELDRRLIFDRMTIEEFIASGCPATWSNATRGNMRSQLFNISEALLGTEARIPRLNPLPPSNPSKPYDVKEIVTFRSWAWGQSTQSKRHDATALLALGAGAGLATEDLLTIHVSDVTLIDGFVIVNVTGRRPRQVPVLAEWEGDLLDVVRETTPGSFVFGQNRTTRQKNAVSNFLSKTTGTHKPNSQRLRATWIVHHLSVATPVKALLGAAGVESFEAFTRFIPFVPEVDPMEARHVLRGNKR